MTYNVFIFIAVYTIPVINSCTTIYFFHSPVVRHLDFFWWRQAWDGKGLIEKAFPSCRDLRWPFYIVYRPHADGLHDWHVCRPGKSRSLLKTAFIFLKWLRTYRSQRLEGELSPVFWGPSMDRYKHLNRARDPSSPALIQGAVSCSWPMKIKAASWKHRGSPLIGPWMLLSAFIGLFPLTLRALHS